MVDYKVLIADYMLIRNELINGDDELIIKGYLECMIIHGDSWPEHFKDVDVFNKNPSELFDTQSPNFVVVKPRTEACGKTDGCESGCWRIIGRDKLIKSEETGKILGFKKILKFCNKRKPREYKRNWVMEEYRVTNNLNWKQDHVICKIRILFEAEISFLLAKHFSYLSTRSPLPPNHSLPAYGRVSGADGESYLRAIINYDGNFSWPSYVANDVYRLHPLTLVDPQDKMFKEFGTCFFTNRKYDGGCWRINDSNVLFIRWSETRYVIGDKRVLVFSEKEGPRNVCEGEDVKGIWIIEEYRNSMEMYDRVVCVLKLLPNLTKLKVM